MRTSFDKAFEIVIGLEGKPSDDPADPGGLTVWGLSKRYNPEVSLTMTIDEAKAIYLKRYWMPSGCDTLPFPMDVCVFDARVNPQDDPDLPGGSMQELMNQSPENWQEYLILRMQRYMKRSKEKYVKGHVFRILRLHKQIKALNKWYNDPQIAYQSITTSATVGNIDNGH